MPSLSQWALLQKSHLLGNAFQVHSSAKFLQPVPLIHGILEIAKLASFLVRKTRAIFQFSKLYTVSDPQPCDEERDIVFTSLSDVVVGNAEKVDHRTYITGPGPSIAEQIGRILATVHGPSRILASQARRTLGALSDGRHTRILKMDLSSSRLMS